jgi:hypothetical protein
MSCTINQYNLSSQFSFLHIGLFPCTPYNYYSIYFGFIIYLTLYPKLLFHFQDHICSCGSQRELECAKNPVFLCGPRVRNNCVWQ